jgi:hypothetical protein
MLLRNIYRGDLSEIGFGQLGFFRPRRGRRGRHADEPSAWRSRESAGWKAALTKLVIYGTAYVTEGGAAELLQRLARSYLGPDVRFPPMDSPPPGYITHITVDRVSGVGPWAQR